MAGAQEAARAALALAPDGRRVNAALGAILYDLGRRSEAIGRMELALSRYEEPPDDLLWRLKAARRGGLRHRDERQLMEGLGLLAASRPLDALPLFEALCAERPRSTPAQLGLRGALHALGRDAEKAEAEARWRAAGPPCQAEIDTALARPLTADGLVFDPRLGLPLLPLSEALTEVGTAAELQKIPNSYVELDGKTARIKGDPVVPLEPDGSDAWPFEARLNRRRMSRIDNAMIVGEGLVVNQQGALISELIATKRHKYGIAVRDGRAAFPEGAFQGGAGKVDVFDVPALLMLGPTDLSYGDWINQFPPRLAIAEAAGLDLPVVVSGRVPSRYVEMLQQLGVRRERILRHGDFVSIFPQLYVPSWPLRSRYEPMRGWLDIYQRVAGPAPAERRRLYLTRSRVGRRNLVNEPQVAEIFRARGFEIVAPETLGMREMIDLFAGPDLVALPYGSAVRGLVFSRRKPTVFAMFPPYSDFYIGGCMMFFAELGCPLGYVRGERAPGLGPGDPNTQDWIVDPTEVERKIDALIRSHEAGALSQL